MTKKGLTAIAVVLDKSGSMQGIRDETISSFNEFLREQKQAPGDTVFSLTLFNQDVDVKHAVRPIYAVQPLDNDSYRPNGYTALYDAVGLTIDAVGATLSALPEEARPERVLFVIQTDGQENSSRRFTADQVKTKIEHQKAKYNWDFIFLGAAQDAWVAAGQMGIAGAKTMSYDPDQQVQTMSIASAYATTFREQGTATKLLDNDIRKKSDK